MKDMLGRFLARWRTKTVLSLIQGHLLDIGCGTNKLVRSYKGQGIGVDVYQWGDVDLVVANSPSLPFQEKTFDTITIVAVINHIPNRTEVLAESYRLLREHGSIVVTMIPPKISAVWHMLRRPWDSDQKERGMKNGKLYGLSRTEVSDLLRQGGFDIVSEKRFMFGVNLLTIAKKP